MPFAAWSAQIRNPRPPRFLMLYSLKRLNSFLNHPFAIAVNHFNIEKALLTKGPDGGNSASPLPKPRKQPGAEIIS